MRAGCVVLGICWIALSMGCWAPTLVRILGW